MPLFRHDILPDATEIGIWQVTESESWFREHLVLYDAELLEIAGLGDKKRMEWLPARYLLHHMSGRQIRGACLKDADGKPFLDESLYHISLSHSADLVAVIASPKLCGLDIQFRTPKLERIAGKFITPPELAQFADVEDPLEFIHFYWGAKESMYKAYGKRKIEFREHMQVNWLPGQMQGYGILKKDEVLLQFDLYAQKIGDYYLVYALSDDKAGIDQP